MKTKIFTSVLLAIVLVSCGGGGDKTQPENMHQEDQNNENQNENNTNGDQQTNLKTQIATKLLRLNGATYSVSAFANKKLHVEQSKKVDYAFSINSKPFSIQIPQAYKNEDISLKIVSLKTNRTITTQSTTAISIPKQDDYAIPFQINQGDDTPQTPIF